MLQSRCVLVVGGGRVGQHKIELLLDSGASIRLVCPECVEELTQLIQEKKIDHRAKCFDESDLEGISMAFACTDDKHVNQAVLQACRKHSIPCCCADGNWADGDFVTPAIIRSGDFLLAVSTSGKSCRQARLIKNNIRRHIDSIEKTDLFVIGTSHLFLPAEKRGDYHLPMPKREQMGELIRQIWGVHEFMIFNTCNRVEVIAVVSNVKATTEILKRLLGFDKLAESEYYVRNGFDAYKHFCMVAAGMKSQTPGEFHIVSQLKGAVQESEEFGWAGSVIHELHDAVLHVSKEIRHAVEPVLVVSEIEDVALKYLDFERPEGVKGVHALVIGNGMVGRGVMKGLVERGCSCVWAYHKHVPEIPAEYKDQIELIQLDQISDALQEIEVVFSAVPVIEPVITKEKDGNNLNPNGTLFIDLGMPHNIDPALDKGEAVVIGLDELKNWFRHGNGSMDKALTLARACIKENKEGYEHIRRSLRAE